jgi:hypothetical protein
MKCIINITEDWRFMKVLLLTANNRLKATQMFAHKNNEINTSDIKKLISGNVEIIFASKVSRLAYLYIMFVGRSTEGRLLNPMASLLAGDDVGPIRGDVVIARTNHLGAGAKTYALDDDEVKSMTERLSKVAANANIELTIAGEQK